jgi:tetratricopeptide (TPR) repeat protein
MDWVYARYPGWFSDIPSLIRRAKENATPRGKAWGMAPLDPPPAAVCLHAGVMLLARRQTAAAAILFERALAAAPDDPTAALYAGLASALSGRKAQASERLSAALRRAGDEKDREFLSQDANVIAELFGLSPIAEAAPDSEAAGALAEAQTLVRQNRPEAARASLEKAQGLRARQETLLNIAKLWLSMKDYRRSSEVIERLMRENPRDPEYPMAAAEAALGAGRRDSALRSLALARGLSPSDDQQRRLSFLYQQAGDFGHALEILRALAQRRPADAGVLKDKGICEYQDGLLDAAAESLKAAISLDPGLLEAYLSLGTLYSGQGRRDQALAVYDQALARTPRPDQAAVRPLIVQSRADLR